MTVSKRKGSDIYNFDFHWRKKRYQGSTGKRDRRAALKFEAEFKNSLKEQAGLAGPRAPVSSTNEERTVGEMARIVASKRRNSRKDKEFFSNLSYLANTIGLDRPIAEFGEAEATRLILSEKIKGLLFGMSRKRFPGPIEPLLPEEFALAGAIATEDELVEILDILVERGAEAERPRVPLGASSMIKNFARPINAMRNEARKMGTIVPDLEALLDKKFGKYGRERLLSATEEAILRASCPWHRREVYDFALQSLLRLSTICGLRWRDVDLGQRVLTVRVKGDKPFTRHISDEMFRLLVAQIDRHPEFVFTRISKRGGQRVPLTGFISELFRRDCRACGIDKICFHDLRRTGATRLYNADDNIEVVRIALGHSHVSTTWLYIVREPGDVAAAERKRAARDRAGAEIAEAMLSGRLGRLPSEAEVLVAIDTKARLDASVQQAVVAAIAADAALLAQVALLVARANVERRCPPLIEAAAAVEDSRDFRSDSLRRKTPERAETLQIAAL